jgi:hypothetical protein
VEQLIIFTRYDHGSNSNHNNENPMSLLLLLSSNSNVYLDAILASSLRLYGFRKAFSSYSGPCICVRRSSDSTEQDIGFDASGYIDTVSLLAFCGAGDGFVKTWYDQSGSGLDVTQSTTTKQPKIVNSGALMQDAGYGCTVKCDGTDDFLLSANYDLTATDEATLLCGIGTIESIGANTAVLYSSGSINNKGIGFLGWNDGKPLATTFTAIGGGSFEGWSPDSPGTGRRILGFKANNSEASGSKVVPFWNNSYSQTGWTQILSSGTTGSFSDNPISMGSASDGTTSSTASFDFICFANRLLTEDEARTISTFFRRSGIMLGDSTTAAYPATVPVASLVYAEADRVKGSPIESLADGGDTIAQQKTLWQANNQRKSVAWVSIQLGLNNMNPASSSTAATIAEYQDLVDTIRADNATCKIIGLTMTPAYENWTDIGWTPAGAQARWVALNDAIMGRGASPITGLDASVESHTLALSMDVSGNAALAVAYQNGDHIHTNTAGRTINAAAIRTALVSLGLV